MEDQNPSQKEPKDSIPDSNEFSNLNTTAQTSSEAKYKISQETNNKIEIEENEKKINENEIIQEAIDYKSASILNLSTELDSILISINTTWENNRQGYFKYFNEEVKPKLNELLSYPCINSNREKVILIFCFLIKYFSSRIKFLKEIFADEIYFMLNIIFGQNPNIFSMRPNVGGIQEYELIEDKYFYHAFKELLPNKEVENTYANNPYNCCYKYFIEFIFQSGFIEAYLNDYLTRNDLSPSEFSSICYFPGNILYLCDKNFILKRDWNLKIIKIINYKISYFLSEKNQYLKDDNTMNNLAYWISIYYFFSTLGIFNYAFDTLITNNLQDCQNFSIIVFRINEHLLKHQKINIRMFGMQYISNLCDNYLKYINKIADYPEYTKKYDDAVKISDFLIKMGITYLKQIKIFDLIFGENIHEGVIQRSFPTLNLLYQCKVFDSSHIKILWNLSQTKYQSISNAIISLFGNLLPEFSIDDCNSILKIVDQMQFKEVNDTTLKLLENFFKGKIRLELLLNILFKFSNELSYEQGLDKNIIFKSRCILIRLLKNSNYSQDLFNYIKKCIFHIHKFYLIDTYFSTLTQILDDLSHPENESLYNNFKFEIEIKNFHMLISFLDEKYKLFPIHMNYLIKIIQLFAFFTKISTNIIEEINKGNFDHDNFFNIDNIYSEYIVYIESNLNFNYNLGNNNKNSNDNNGMDIETTNNINNNPQEDIFPLDLEFANEIKANDYENYIKNLIKDYAKYFKGILTSTNIAPSIHDTIYIIFHKLQLGFPKLTYSQFINNIMKSMYWNHIHSYSNFKLPYLNFLYNLAQSCKNIDSSLTWYYDLLCELFKSRIMDNNEFLLSDESMKELILTQIKNSNYETMPISAFNTFLFFSIYVNQKISNAIYSPLIQKFTEIKNFKNFHGFDVFWNFYIYTKINIVETTALNTIINILELISKKEEDRNHSINEIFNYISENKNKINDNPQIKISIIRSLKVISVILGTKINKDLFENKNNNNGNNNINVTIKNHYDGLHDNQDYNISISNEQKVSNLKEFIINHIICTEPNLAQYNKTIQTYNDSILNQAKYNNYNDIYEEEKMNIESPTLRNLLSMEQFKKIVYDSSIIISYKNTVLKDDFLVADYHIEEKSTLLIFKGGGKKEEEFIPSEDLLKEGYIAIQSLFGDNLYFGEDVMKASIIKHKGNLEEAGLYLTNPDNVKILQKEIQEKQGELKQKHDDIICLEEEKMNLLIEVLNNNNDKDINNQIWELFASIKYPENIIKGIIEKPLDNILKINETNKMILYLDIIDSLIFDGEFCKYNKLNIDQKNSWISNFIKNEGLVKYIYKVLDNLDTKTPSFQIFMVIKIFVGWLHKILLKICEVINIEANTSINIISEIKTLRTFNSHDNIQNNNSNNNGNNNNNENNDDKKNEEFKIVDIQDGIKFLNILGQIKAEIIFYKLINLLTKSEYFEGKDNLLEKICEFILISLILQKNSLPQFCSIEKNKKILIHIIIFSQFPMERKIIKNFFKVLVRVLMPLTDPSDLITENNIFTAIFETFIQELLSGLNFNEEFLDIFSHLLVYTTNDIIQKAIEPLIYKFLKDIYEFCTNIDKCNDTQRIILKYEIYAVYGCLKFYQKIIMNYINQIYIKQKQDYILFLYDFLFLIEKDDKTQKINSYKFKDNFIRSNLFNLLTELISLDNNYLQRILPKIITHHKKLEIPDPNKIETPIDVNIRSPNEKLIGLRNFGSTCYLNSLTQQMFMMPSFRKDLFNNFIITQDIKDMNKSEELKYSVIYNLQLTFENLKYGSMSPYPPKRFIKSFLSAFNGEPIQFGVQQDSDEFLAILCDNLEKEAKSYNKENFLENSFKGKISNEILSLEKEYPYYSQSEEPFFRITLDIKGHKSLEEALDAYVKGEILDGDNKYYVEEHKRKISIRKSSSLKILGNVVIIHLKRFEFDFVTFNNYKLSDYLKFPTKINFKKWTRAFLRRNNKQLKISDEEKRNLLDENMEYILTGILVHGGSNIQSGHYYSYIMDQETGKWYQFNDNSISDYNIDTDLEKECFGNMGGNNINQYGRTAYLLFYTKKSIFRNKNLLENININQAVLKDVYNENINFLNMNIYLNNNYFNFLRKICLCGIPLLKDRIQDEKGSDLTLTNYLKRNISIYKKIHLILKPDNDNNDFVDENEINNEENQEKNIINLQNFEQVYNKCKDEVDSLLKKEKEENKKINNFIYKKKLIKLYFNYVFGILFPQFNNYQNQNNQNQDMLMKAFQTLIDILKSNKGYSLWILKQVEKNISLFTDFIFRFGTAENELNDMAKLIAEFFQITFDTIYNFEKNNIVIATDIVKYYIKNDQGNFNIMKEYRSIIMRLIKKLFCDNLEKSRIEYSRNSLYLYIFYYLVQNCPESALIIVNYFFSLISLITNNTLSTIKSEINPNYLMGNNNNYQVNYYYILIFCDTILRCVTPGMKNSSSYSPYFLNSKQNSTNEINYYDLLKYPCLPNNWEKILSIEFYVNCILFNPYSKSKEITCHLSYCDEQTSFKILKLVCEFSKTKTFFPFIEKVFNNVLCVFDLKDNLDLIRADALFELDDKNYEEPIDVEEQHKTLFNYFEEQKEDNMKFILIMLYNIGKAIEKYDVISKYFEKNKNKLEWIAKFIFMIKNDQNTKDKFIKDSGYILNQHPDLLQVIQESIIQRYQLK